MKAWIKKFDLVHNLYTTTQTSIHIFNHLNSIDQVKERKKLRLKNFDEAI